MTKTMYIKFAVLGSTGKKRKFPAYLKVALSPKILEDFNFSQKNIPNP